MNIWFTADEHYGHRNIIKFCKRPFDDLAGMREELIRRHNMLVEPGDIVHHVGDMFWRTLSDDEAVAILSRLNGDHFYVLGNHEEVVNNSLLVQRAFFDIKERRHIVPPKGPQKGIVLDHYSGCCSTTASIAICGSRARGRTHGTSGSRSSRGRADWRSRATWEPSSSRDWRICSSSSVAVHPTRRACTST